MPWYLEASNRTQTLTDAINVLLESGGPAALSMRAIARTSGVSTGSIYQHLDNRARLTQLAARRTMEARLSDLEWRTAEDGLWGFLPRTDDQLLDERVWRAWQELSRAEDHLAHIADRAHQREKQLLARVTDFALAIDDLEITLALIAGLSEAVCRAEAPMRRGRARELLATHAASWPPRTRSRAP